MSLGKRVEVAALTSATNHELRRATDRFIPLKQLADKIGRY